MFLFVIGLASIVVHQDYRRSAKRLSTKHTFLEQFCLPDECLSDSIDRVYLEVLATTMPKMLEVKKTRTVPNSGLSVSYTQDIPVQVQFWAQVYTIDVEQGTFSVLNYFPGEIETPNKRADCIEVRYFASFTGDGQYLWVTTNYTINVYWVRNETTMLDKYSTSV
jgi:hypothetical protein